MSTTPDARPAGDDAKAVKRGGRIVAAVIAGSLLLYWLADRYTPYTSQARVDGYVIGIAPKVAGEVVKVSVINNQTVKAGQPLFQIDPSQYRIGLDKARSDLDNARRQVGAGSAAPVAEAPVDVPTEVDFETEATTDITDKNVEAKLKSLEGELAQ